MGYERISYLVRWLRESWTSGERGQSKGEIEEQENTPASGDTILSSTIPEFRILHSHRSVSQEGVITVAENPNRFGNQKFKQSRRMWVNGQRLQGFLDQGSQLKTDTDGYEGLMLKCLTLRSVLQNNVLPWQPSRPPFPNRYEQGWAPSPKPLVSAARETLVRVLLPSHVISDRTLQDGSDIYLEACVIDVQAVCSSPPRGWRARYPTAKCREFRPRLGQNDTGMSSRLCTAYFTKKINDVNERYPMKKKPEKLIHRRRPGQLWVRMPGQSNSSPSSILFRNSTDDHYC
ncbi:hypothetical protein RRG08_048593 [Elysia crispata]|uniref:Uncharacterized protein n=1 Tax=Elysia crispata TaxID=231223 RepID=A0AAE1AEZ6_9GAST|nr:hypothetical protein RRG08_048593 [Elysia crispata]